MPQNINFERYKNLDFTEAKLAINNPMIKKLQDNAKIKHLYWMMMFFNGSTPKIPLPFAISTK